MRRHLIYPAGTALALVLSVSACSSSGGAGGADPQPEPSEDTTSAATREALVSPLDDYMGVGAGVATTVDDASMREFEERIASCMAAEGFEYVPYVAPYDATFLPDGTVMLEERKPTFPDLPPAEFAARFGYGISTRPPAGPEQEDVDPNDAIVERMSVAERVAYHQALYGDGNQLDSQGYLAGAGIASSDSSCQGRADAGAPTTEEAARAEQRVEKVQKSFASLLKRVRELRDDQRQDPRVVSATSTWAGCLAAAGHSGFADLDEPRASARAAAERLLGRDLSGAASADPAKLAELRRAEVELAVADERCLVAWRETFQEVKADLEERFVHDNVAELEDFRSAMSAAVAD